MGLAMASYQNPDRSAGSFPPSSLNWGGSLDPQDEPPRGDMPLPPPVAAPPQVQHAIQPHPFAEPTPYSLAPPPLHDVPPASSRGPGYGYPAYSYTGAEPRESGLAKAALWIGILGGWLPVNLFVGAAAIAETGPGKKRGRDKAVIGLCASLVWVVLLGGIAYAVRHHRVDPPPAIPRRPTLAASADPGCWAGASAVFAFEGTLGGPAAEVKLGNALIAAAGRSRLADAPLRKLGLDYLALAQGAAVPSLDADADAAGRVCGLSFRVD